jgi:flagellar export protein FliJ
MSFKFRAQAALDLRRRENDDARRAVARAETDLRTAQQLLAQIEARARDARIQCAAVMIKPGGTAELQWYRSWIGRLDRDRSSAAKVVADREAALARAQEAQRLTGQRLESLERFKEKAMDAFAERGRAEERKFIDALATMRFTGRSREREESSQGDRGIER